MEWYQPGYDRTMWHSSYGGIMVAQLQNGKYAVYFWRQKEWALHPQLCDTREAAQATAEAIWELEHD